MDDDRGDGPGEQAIAAHADRIDGSPPAAHFSFVKPGTVAGVSVYAVDQPAHWHLLTYGLSPDWGFELSFRLPRAEDDDPPAWAVNLLANLGAYVISSGHPFAAGHHIDLRGPMRLGDDTHITAAAIATDPGLGTTSTPVGPVEFLQVVGLSADELELCRAWRTDAVIDLLKASDPLLITHLDRPSLLDDPSVRELAEAGVAAEGSSLNHLQVGTLRLDQKRRHFELTMGAGAATGLGPALRRKLNRDGATFELMGDGGEVHFVVDDEAGWDVADGEVILSVPLDRVDELAGLFTGRTGQGRLPWLPGLRFIVVP
jgi:hypothetical protein